MYILFEKVNSSESSDILNYDAMGYVTSEANAIEWVNKNSEYRLYKYCPDINKD